MDSADVGSNEDASAATFFYVYRGEEDFEVPETVTRVRVDSGITTIQEQAFRDCNDLESVEIPVSGLTNIEYRAFSNCWSLREINFPDSLRYLGPAAFNECHALTNISLPNGLESIERFAFHDCMSLRCVALPPSLRAIRERAFGQCTELASMELPKGLHTIESDSFRGCTSLINLCLPPTTTEIGATVFRYATVIQEEFGDTEMNILCAFQHRFRGLPVHQLCYYQGFYPMEETLGNLKRIFVSKEWSSRIKQVDMFGMTVFHVLSMSSRPNLFLFKALGSYCPDLLEQQDKWMKAPLDYLCMIDAPNAMACIEYVIQVSVKDRLNTWLGLDAWRTNMQIHIDLFSAATDRGSRMGTLQLLRRSFELLLLMEKMALLELALWKVKLLESASLDSVDRQNCLINCGADAVVSQVLPFLESPAVNS